MILDKLILTNYRNYEKLFLNFGSGVNIIFGNNAQGKTNILESIYFLSLCNSHRVNENMDIISNGKKSSKIEGVVKIGRIVNDLEIKLFSNNKILTIDSNRLKKISDYVAFTYEVILFSPDDLELVKGSPNIRRNFLNNELVQLSNSYHCILNDFNKLLKMRNDYLKKTNVENFDNIYFEILTNHYIDKCLLIYKIRKKFVEKLNSCCGSILLQLGKFSDFHIKYINNISEVVPNKEYMVTKLKDNFDSEIKCGVTLYGPHRDDLEFYLGSKMVKSFCSQGQIRLIVLCIKLSEIDIYFKANNRFPIILLDDVFSELDDDKKNAILDFFDNNIQIFITMTNIKKLCVDKLASATLFHIHDGQIISEKEVGK